MRGPQGEALVLDQNFFVDSAFTGGVLNPVRDEDLIVTTLTGQGSDLFVNDGSGVFVEQSARTGLRAASLPLTAFSACST